MELRLKEQTKHDLTLSNGKEVTFDFNNITIREWRSLFDIKQSEEEEYRLVGKLIGMETEEVASLGFQDWIDVLKIMKAKARELNANPT